MIISKEKDKSLRRGLFSWDLIFGFKCMIDLNLPVKMPNGRIMYKQKISIFKSRDIKRQSY